MKDKYGFNLTTVEDVKLEDIKDLPEDTGLVCYIYKEYDNEGRINLVIRWRLHYDY